MTKVRLSDLHPTAPANLHPEFYDRVYNHVIEHGMQHPLVVLECSVQEWATMCRLSPDLLPPPPHLRGGDIVYLIMCGNNRYEIAKNLGWEEVECVIETSREKTSQLCIKQRKEWKNLK